MAVLSLSVSGEPGREPSPSAAPRRKSGFGVPQKAPKRLGCYWTKNENADLITDTLTSWQMSHFAHASGMKMKSMIAQKMLWWIACPTMAVATPKIVQRIPLFLM
jgi:hypothetical protein